MKVSAIHQKNLKKPAYRKACYDLQWDVAHEISKALVMARIQSGLSQEELAKKMGTKQPAIARAEAGSIVPSNTFLNEAAKAMGLVLDIKFKKAKSLKDFIPRNTKR